MRLFFVFRQHEMISISLTRYDDCNACMHIVSGFLKYHINNALRMQCDASIRYMYMFTLCA